MLRERLVKTFSKLGCYEYCEIKTEELLFDKAVLDQCALNSCGMYGKNHSCPPKSGTIDTIKNRIYKYNYAFLINKIINLNSMEEMTKSIEEFNKTLCRLRTEFESDNVLVMGAGPCKYCKECSALIDKPCLFPDKIQYSIEGSGINVVQMSIDKKMTYNAGNGKVAYFGLLLYG